MACNQEIQMLMSCYADGEATLEEATRAEEHLGHCIECRKLVEQWKEQRQLLEWAYTSDLPKESDTMEFTPSAQMKINAASKVEPLRRNIRQWNWLKVGMAAAAVIIAFAIYSFALLPPALRVGEKAASAKDTRRFRMGSSIRLEIGPGSEIKRIDEKTIKLERGWLLASVHHLTEFQVITDRIQVTDRGTRFQVASNPEMDYVVVEEGSVLVAAKGVKHTLGADQLLMAPRDGKLSIAAFPAAQPGDEDTNARLISEAYPESAEFKPKSAEDLDWEEGLRKLGNRFPDARWDGGSGSSHIYARGRSHRYHSAKAPGIKKALRVHFGQIARAMTGGPVNGSWEIPIGYLQADGIVPLANLSYNTHYIRLAAVNGKLIWKLSAVTGSDVEFPVEFQKVNPEQQNGSANSGPDGYIAWADSFDKNGEMSLTLQLLDWPGNRKPVLHLKLGEMPQSADVMNDKALQDEIIKSTSLIDMKPGSSSVMCLDSERKHRLAILWNNEAGIELCRLSDSIKRGRGGVVILGAIASEMPFREPSVEKGMYLLRFVQQDTLHSPHMELMPLSDFISASNRPVYILPDKGPKNDGGGSGWSMRSLPNHGTMDFRYTPTAARSGAFRFDFQIIGRPDSTSKTNVWVEGRILVRKP